MAKDVDSTSHPEFAGPEDTVLHSGDGVAFHIASAHLTNASGWFRTLFTVPQADGASRGAGTVELTVDEDALTLEILLNLCRARAPGLARLENLADLEHVLRAAEKYDMPGATEVLLLMLHAPRMQTDTLHLYALATRYWQEDAAESAFRRLLDMRIDFENVARVDGAPLLRLVAARQKRVERFCMLLAQKDDTGPFYAENNRFCPHCREADRSISFMSVAYAQWLALVIALQTAFFKHPSVDALQEDEQVKLHIAALEPTACGHTACRRPIVEWPGIWLRLQAMKDSI